MAAAMAQNGSSIFPRGSVVSIKLANFLTYDFVEAKPAPGLNLLLGPNGSGKSTFVCALCLGLAGKPHILGRSTRMADYVKYGKDNATIEIELSSGDDSKNPVIKTIIRGATNKEDYTVNGQKMNQTQVREFVKKYHIQVDNLCQFLAQDKVVEFARQSKGDLLVNTEKAAGSDNLHTQHMELKESFVKGSDLRKDLSGISDRKKLLEQRLVSLEQPFRQYEEYEKRKEKLSMLQKKRPWVEYELMEKEADGLKMELNQAKANYLAQEAHLKPLRDGINQARDDEFRANSTFDEQMRQIDNIERRVDNDLARLDRMDMQEEAARSHFRFIREEYGEKAMKIEELEKTINDLHQKLESARDEDLRPEIEAKEQEIHATSRKLDELEPRQEENVAKLKTESEKLVRVKHQLISLQNRQGKLLEQVQKHDGHAHSAYMWLNQNREQFRGSVWLPALDMFIPNRDNIKYIETCVGKRDLFSFVFESFEDMKLFLAEMKRRGIRVAAGEVPNDPVDYNVCPPSELKSLGFQEFVCNMFEAPDGLKKYLTRLSGLNRVPVGSQETERKLEQASTAVRAFGFSKFLTPSKQLAMSNSRYGGDRTVMNQALWKPNILHNTTSTATNDLQEGTLKKQLSQAEKEVGLLQAQVNESSEIIRGEKRRLEKLRNDTNALKNRTGERTALLGQIDFKSKKLQEEKRALPDIDVAEAKYTEQCGALVVEKMEVCLRMANYFMEASAEKCPVLADCGIVHWSSSDFMVSQQRKLEESSAELKELKAQLDKLQADLTEKRGNVQLLLEQAQRAIGLRPHQNKIPDAILAAFKELPNDLEQLDEQIEDQRTLLERTQGIDKSVAIEYKARQDELHHTIIRETQLQAAIVSWEEEVAVVREQWLTELRQLIETISRNFSRFMSVLDCAGEVDLEQPEDINNFVAYGIRIKVKFRDNEPLRELDPQHQSGGERSVSTMLYMLALQELSHVPFRCVDEINQGMDPINERKVFEMMTKLLSGEGGALNCTQYFMLTPKLLRGLSLGEDNEVWVIHNGPGMEAEEFDGYKFILRKKAQRLAGL